MKRQLFVLGVFGVFIFLACNQPNKENTVAKEEPQQAVIEDSPAYQPSSTVEGNLRTINGECIVFYHPSKKEMGSIPNSSTDLKRFLDVVDNLRPELESKGYAVYVSSDELVQMKVSDSRSHQFERPKMASKFGAVFYGEKNAPFFCEGLRDAEGYMTYINRYFKED